jgi:hypothetical protein
MVLNKSKIGYVNILELLIIKDKTGDEVMLFWMVIYPMGNRKVLDIAQVRDYEKSDWDLASQREFEEENECKEYMIKLANRNSLRYSGDTAYLD